MEFLSRASFREPFPICLNATYLKPVAVANAVYNAAREAVSFAKHQAVQTFSVLLIISSYPEHRRIQSLVDDQEAESDMLRHCTPEVTEVW